MGEDIMQNIIMVGAEGDIMQNIMRVGVEEDIMKNIIMFCIISSPTPTLTCDYVPYNISLHPTLIMFCIISCPP